MTASTPSSSRISTSRATASTTPCIPVAASWSGVPGSAGRWAIAITGFLPAPKIRSKRDSIAEIVVEPGTRSKNRTIATDAGRTYYRLRRGTRRTERRRAMVGSRSPSAGNDGRGTVASALITGETVDPTEGETLARNALGLREVLFCIVTGAAPIAAMQFNVPWAVGGAGYAGPATFLLATIVLTIFSVGYIEMARRVTAAGGFYSFISHAFGSVVGMGAAITIALSYTIFAAANVGVTAYFTQSNVASWTNGSVDIPI